MESNIASIYFKDYDEVFKKFHGISSSNALDISSEEFNRMNSEIDDAFGLKFVNTELDKYIFKIKDKNKYLWAKLKYGA